MDWACGSGWVGWAWWTFWYEGEVLRIVQGSLEGLLLLLLLLLLLSKDGVVVVEGFRCRKLVA